MSLVQTRHRYTQTRHRYTDAAPLYRRGTAIDYFLGGPAIHGFSIAFIIGIVVGTYSSIYVAGALAVACGLSRKDLIPVVKKEADERP